MNIDDRRNTETAAATKRANDDAARDAGIAYANYRDAVRSIIDVTERQYRDADLRTVEISNAVVVDVPCYNVPNNDPNPLDGAVSIDTDTDNASMRMHDSDFHNRIFGIVRDDDGVDGLTTFDGWQPHPYIVCDYA